MKDKALTGFVALLLAALIALFALVAIGVIGDRAEAAETFTHNNAYTIPFIKSLEEQISYSGDEGKAWHFSHGYYDIATKTNETIDKYYIVLNFRNDDFNDSIFITTTIKDGNYYKTIQVTYEVKNISKRILNFLKEQLDKKTIISIEMNAMGKKGYNYSKNYYGSFINNFYGRNMVSMYATKSEDVDTIYDLIKTYIYK